MEAVALMYLGKFSSPRLARRGLARSRAGSGLSVLPPADAEACAGRSLNGGERGTPPEAPILTGVDERKGVFIVAKPWALLHSDKCCLPLRGDDARRGALLLITSIMSCRRRPGPARRQSTPETASRCIMRNAPDAIEPVRGPDRLHTHLRQICKTGIIGRPRRLPS